MQLSYTFFGLRDVKRISHIDHPPEFDPTTDAKSERLLSLDFPLFLTTDRHPPNSSREFWAVPCSVPLQPPHYHSVSQH